MTDETTAINALRKCNALLVHCAGYAKMVGTEQTNQMKYLERLQVAAQGGLELACSTVQVGDWASLEDIRNYTGPCGLILRPKGAEAITYAWPGDAGTSIGKNGRRSNVRADALVYPLEEAIAHRLPDKYNEIGVLGYEVVGVFVDQAEFQISVPDCQVADRMEALGNPTPDQPGYLEARVETINAKDVRAAFLHFDLFRLHNGNLHWLVRNGQPETGPVSLDYVYGLSTD